MKGLFHMIQADSIRSTLHEALGFEEPLRELRNLSWAIVMMAESLDDEQAGGAVNDVACAVYDRATELKEKWDALIDHLLQLATSFQLPPSSTLFRRCWPERQPVDRSGQRRLLPRAGPD
jgi:hypothetical protein